jgi:Na+/glutamate symporter
VLLGPAFGFSDKGGALIELSFAGGHGTLAGLGPVFEEYGAGELVEVGLGLATIGLVTGVVIGIVLLELFRWIFGLFGSDFFERFPLFPFTIIGGVLVQLAAVRSGFGWAVNRRAVEGLGGLSIDGIVICAIGTLSLERPCQQHWPPW